MSPWEGNAAWSPRREMDLLLRFHPFLRRSGFDNHCQLFVILSYFETDDLAR